VSFDIIGGRDQEQDLEFEALPTSLPETSLRALDAHFGQTIITFFINAHIFTLMPSFHHSVSRPRDNRLYARV
jgi:hypothetical protein